MFNPFIIVYFIVLAFFIGGVAVVTYHLVKYQLNKKATLATTWVFLIGSAVLILINALIAFGIDWSQFSIIIG